MCGYVHTWYSESLRAIDMLVKEWKVSTDLAINCFIKDPIV